MTFAEIGALLNFLIVIVFVYLVFSLSASLLVEMLSTALAKRGALLRARIAGVFDDVEETGFAGLLMKSPLLQSYMNESRLPSYLPSQAFSQAVIAIIKEHRKDTDAIIELRDLPPVLRTLAAGAGTDLNDKSLDAFRDVVAKWYDQVMDRLTGTYRRWARRRLFVAGLILAIGFNVNFLHITQSIWTGRFTLDQAVRQIEDLHVAVKDKTTSEVTAADLLMNDEALRTKVAAIVDGSTPGVPALPIGWTIADEDCPTDRTDATAVADAQKAGMVCSLEERLVLFYQTARNPPTWDWAAMLGWLLSALMVLPGTNFWFDSLSKLFSIRSAGSKPAPVKDTQTDGGGG